MLIEIVVVCPAKSLALILKFVPGRALGPVPLQLFPLRVKFAVMVAPLTFVQLTETDATATSSVTNTVQALPVAADVEAVQTPE